MRKGAVIAIIIIAVVVIGGVVGFLIYNNSQGSGSINFSTGGSGESGQGLVFEDNQLISDKVIPSVTMPGWKSMTIAANTKDVEVDFYNPEANAGKYYLTFELLVNGESLYKSGLIKAGDHVRQITLSKALAPGTYEAVAHIQPYSADEALTAKNNANVNFTLIVQ